MISNGRKWLSLYRQLRLYFEIMDFVINMFAQPNHNAYNASLDHSNVNSKAAWLNHGRAYIS